MLDALLLGIVLVTGAPHLEASQGHPDIGRTQLTIRLGPRQFQATVVEIEESDARLVVVTAAHCVSARDAGEAVSLRQGGRAVVGRILAAARNPDYHPVAARDHRTGGVQGVLCVDNAVAEIEVVPEEPDEDRDAFLRGLRAADVAPEPVPGVARQTVTVHILDQHGEEHVVKAGNHLNPKCLAWGNRSYRPMPGDSGAGVFLVRETPNGKARNLLIGNVALSDDRGGIAPLVSRRSSWVDRALSHAEGPGAR